MNKILSLFFRKRKYPRRVMLHCPSGDMISDVSRDGIVQVPWFLRTCPFRIEDGGAVTLRLMWGNTPAAGYGKVWNLITWEPIEGE